jgi:glycosyltransferase involved in cell wall biosynthesis
VTTPAVSVIVPFFNGERFFEETIASVLAQTFQDWDLWLVDDAGTDGSAAIARRFAAAHPGRIHVIQHEGGRNRGAAASRNLGISSSAGELVAFLDADDVWLPEKLAQQTLILNMHPSVGMLYSQSRYWHSWTGEAADRDRDFVPDPIVETETVHAPRTLLTRLYPLGKGPTPCPSNLMLRRRALVRSGGLEESFHGIYQLYEDQAFLAKIFLREEVYVASTLWDLYRIHEDSCVPRVNEDGRYHEVRHHYLKWFARYLDDNAIHDAQLSSALDRALRVYEPKLIDRLTSHLPWRKAAR